MTNLDDCVSCQRGADPLPPLREAIASDEWWRVAHATDTAVPGWLVLLPRRHVTAVADLTDDDEAAGLGSWQVRVSRAVGAVTGCRKTYVVQFAEADGFQHVHFHLVPHHPDLPADLRGPRIFSQLGKGAGRPVTDAQMDAIATRLRQVLAV